MSDQFNHWVNCENEHGNKWCCHLCWNAGRLSKIILSELYVFVTTSYFKYTWTASGTAFWEAYVITRSTCSSRKVPIISGVFSRLWKDTLNIQEYSEVLHFAFWNPYPMKMLAHALESWSVVCSIYMSSSVVWYVDASNFADITSWKQALLALLSKRWPSDFSSFSFSNPRGSEVKVALSSVQNFACLQDVFWPQIISDHVPGVVKRDWYFLTVLCTVRHKDAIEQQRKSANGKNFPLL